MYDHEIADMTHIKAQPRDGRPPVPPRPSSRKEMVTYDINGIYYKSIPNDDILDCIKFCIGLSKEHTHPVEFDYNGTVFEIDWRCSGSYVYWHEEYKKCVDGIYKAPFTVVKEEGKPKGFGTERIDKPSTPPRTRSRKGRPPTVGCSRCDGEWGKCKHSDGSTEARKLDDNILWFFFGCLFGLIAAYIIGTNLIGA